MKTTLRISGIILLILSIFLIHSCKKDKTTPPTIITTDVSAISYTTAASGGDVTNEGGAPVVSRGVCWNTSTDPTIENSKTTETGGSGAFTSNITLLTTNTMYYVRAYATNNAGTGYGNQVSFTTSQVAVPVLTTTAITSITQTTAVSGGNIIDDKGGSVTVRGVCYGTATNPTTANNITTDGAETGAYISSITGLTANTTYYVRAYATNYVGTAYGNELSFITSSAGTTVTDIDGNVYNTITIGTQVWMKENLKTTKYRNGVSIGTTSPYNMDISGESAPTYQWAYAGNESNVTTYGRLYTWYAVTDNRNVCPTGWHLPSDAEWTTLENYLIANGYNYDGTTTGNKIAKALASTTLWTSSTNTGAVGNTDYPAKRNATGFTALPGGYRYGGGEYDDVGSYGNWWSSTASLAWYRYMYYGSTNVGRSYDDRRNGFSVRCVRD